ncbi:glycolate oxidase subunit GlcE [Azospirillum thermophilum]|uniref:Glycolate oxidase subunit GlcE n=1 Tax=Azospirillum thermophilum TaxID=2202148 RepID=A0A2S2CPU1_9PROT|nr:glycolate oxidase subunit GlcE [Azospirillum thermophilum]AWK86469.1 glycolate oxidase subunit GlcE [Azospirillum thermophilum]
MTVTTLKPETPDQLVEAVRWALSAGEPLELLGSGSKRGLGRPVQAGHALDLSAFSGIVAYEPEELVLTARAGTPMADILPLLAGARQHLAFEPPDTGALYGRPAGEGTLGGLLASGLAGPRRISAGSARDHTLGIAGVSGRGELYKGGGKVVKNVTGYDMPKLMAGSFGTLTALTEVTVKVLPAPEDSRTLLVAGLDDAAAVAALGRALRSPHEVSGAAHLPANVAGHSSVAAVAEGGGAMTLVRVEGFGPSVAARVAALKEELRADAVLDRDASLALWREVRDAVWFAPPGNGAPLPHLWKLSVPPAEGPRVAEAIRRTLEAELFFDWGGGLLWVALPGDGSAEAASAIRRAVGASGHATLVRAPEQVRAAADVFHPLPEPVMALTRRVKESFDPRGVLNPGRLYAGV